MKLAKALVSKNIQPIRFYTTVNKQESMITGSSAQMVTLCVKRNMTGILQGALKKASEDSNTHTRVIKQAAG